jgi:molybdate transport system ATP-binding protein/molybdate/tungstate transport system ATP-binding protein
MIALEVSHLSAQIGEFLLKDISFKVLEGEIFVIVGENGAGKTKLLDSIAGFLSLKEGKVTIRGKNVTNAPPSARPIGYIFQNLALFPHLTVKENILYGTHFRHSGNLDDRFQTLIRFFKCENLLDKYPYMLSGGEKQKIALARALILDPQVILLDEPTSAFSPRERERVDLELKKTFKELKQTAVVVTHNVNEAYLLSDRIAVISKGQIIQIGEPEHIVYKPVSLEVADAFYEMNTYEGVITKASEGIVEAEVKGEKFYFLGDESVGSKVKLFVRPEDIILKKELSETSARNNFKGIVKSISLRSPILRIVVEGPVPFIVYITKQSLEELNVQEEDKVYLSFKISAVHGIKV